jgi:CRP-like cAMP-binding protein
VTLDEIAEALGDNEIFGVLNEQTRRLLAEHVDAHVHHKGETVITQDELGMRMFVVVSGGVRIIRRSREGTVVELTRKSPGQIFGELALLDNGPRSASVETTVKTTLLSIHRDVFIGVLQREPATIEPLLHVLGRMVREVASLSTDLALLDLKSRLAQRLLVLADDGNGGFDHLVAAKRVSQVQLAQMVGGTRQTVNAMLQELENDGCIRLVSDGIEVVSASALRQMKA